MPQVPNKKKLPLALWGVFILIDTLIVVGVLAAIFWVAPVPPAFASGQSMAQARSAKPTGLGVALITSDSCLSCQMYKRGAMADARVTRWIKDHAGAVYLRWGQDQEQIDSLHVTGYPTTVVFVGDEVLASHTGGMSGDDLLAFLEAAAARLGASGSGSDSGSGAGSEPGSGAGPDASGPVPSVPAPAG